VADTVQQHLWLTTERETLRAECIGWSAEDPRQLRPGPIGMTPGFPEPYTYQTVFHALAAGWKLLAPPQNNQPEGAQEIWEWWLVREVPRG
jgi:hypothetical protein